MGFAERLFLTRPSNYGRLHFISVPKIEGDRAINLCQAKGWIVGTNRLRQFVIPIFANYGIQRHTAPHEIKTSGAALHIVLVHSFHPHSTPNLKPGSPNTNWPPS